MKVSKKFRILFTSNPAVNKFMQSLDLMKEGEGIYTEKIFTVTWKDGEVVDDARVAQTAANIKKAIELQGGEVASITEISERKLYG